MTIPSESYGNIYQMISGEMFPALAGSSIACIVFPVLLIADSLFILYVAVIRHDTQGAQPLAILGHNFFLALLIIGCVMMRIVGKEDGGMGMISVGAAPILIVVFSALEIVLSIAAECVRGLMLLHTPEGAKAHAEKVALRKNNREKRHARTVHAYQAVRNEKGKPCENASYPRAWLYFHRISLSVTAVTLAAAITLTCVLATRDTRFNVKNILKIGLPANEQKVIDVLGEPFEIKGNTWYYFSKNYMSIQKKMDKLMESDSLSDAIEQSVKLEEKLETLEYRAIIITFSGTDVQSMMLDASAKGSSKLLTVYHEKQVVECNLSNTRFWLNTTVESTYYTVSYSDGSFCMAYLPAFRTTEAGEQTIQWSNAWGSYSATITVLAR